MPGDEPDTGVDAGEPEPEPSTDVPEPGLPGPDAPEPTDPEPDAGAPGRVRMLAGVGAGAVVVLLLIVVAATRPAPVDGAADGALRTATRGGATLPTLPDEVAGTTFPDELPPVVEDPPTTPTTRKPRRDPTGPAGPLTGAAVDYPGYERRSALVVKIDNDDLGARPQAGLTLADIVYEEKVEGGITRFAAVFQGSDADPVGPIRSARSTDVTIVGSLAIPLFAYSGANAGFEELIRQAPLRNVGASVSPGVYFRGWDHPMPHNLYANTSSLYRLANSDIPLSQWSFRGDGDRLPAGARRTGGAYFNFGGGVTSVVWRWRNDDKAFQREQNGRIHFDADNWPVQAKNVIVQFVDYVDTGYRDTVGAPVPEAQLIGTGGGWVLTGGYAVPVTWEKKDLADVTRYYDGDGNEVAMLPGRSWVELVPNGGGISIQPA